MRNAIIGTGGFLPDKIVSNDDIAQQFDTSDEWIVRRTGIKVRHFAQEHELSSDLALKAAEEAIKNADIDKNDIELIIVATATPDKTFPATATILQHKLKIMTTTAFDIAAACSGFVYAVTVGDALMHAKAYKTALIVGTETFSRILNPRDRATSVLFGDGAGAIVMKQSHDKNGIYFNKIYSDAGLGDVLKTSGGVSESRTAGFIEMNGREVFKIGVEKMSAIIKEAMKFHNNDVDWIIPHQANIRMIHSIAELTSVPIEKFLITVDAHANTSAASIPLALHHFVSSNVIKKSDTIVFTSIGAGITWGGFSIIY